MVKHFLVEQEMPALLLKRSILTHIRLAMAIFYSQRALLHIVQGVKFSNQLFIIKLNSYISVLETMLFLYLLIALRPRKEWPQYFAMDVGAGLRGRNNRNGAGQRGRGRRSQNTVAQRVLV